MPNPNPAGSNFFWFPEFRDNPRAAIPGSGTSPEPIPLDKALALSEQHLALARQAGDQRAIAEILESLGSLYAQLGRRDQAVSCLEEALTLARTLNDARLVRWMTARLTALKERTDPSSGQAPDASPP